MSAATPSQPRMSTPTPLTRVPPGIEAETMSTDSSSALLIGACWTITTGLARSAAHARRGWQRRHGARVTELAAVHRASRRHDRDVALGRAVHLEPARRGEARAERDVLASVDLDDGVHDVGRHA